MIRSALDIATAFVRLSEPEVGDTLSNLKLQKLLYYAQGFNLALNGEPLFEEKIYAWEHGPVVPEVYHHFKKFGSNPISTEEAPEVKDEFTSSEIDLISEVNSVYGQFSAWKLRDMTHGEEPWISTDPSQEITKDKLVIYFRNLVNN